MPLAGGTEVHCGLDARDLGQPRRQQALLQRVGDVLDDLLDALALRDHRGEHQPGHARDPHERLGDQQPVVGRYPANGPLSASANAIATPAAIRLVAVAPGCQNRSAAQISGGKIR